MPIKTLPSVRVAYMRHTGPLSDGDGIGRLWGAFSKWCEREGLHEHGRRPMYGVTQDNPMTTAPVDCRYDVCVEVEDAFEPTPDVATQRLPGGTYACEPFHGTAAEIGAAWRRVFDTVLPASGHRPTGGPALEYYDRHFSLDPDTHAFPCLLCVPVAE